MDLSQACALGGDLTANGSNGITTSSGGSGGGGAGGSILVRCPTLTLSVSGNILVLGGSGGGDTTASCCAPNAGRGGGGAGGRIALHAEFLNFHGANVSAAGGLTGSGPGLAGSSGGNGTIFAGSLEPTNWTVVGVAEGGEVVIQILGAEVVVGTNGGESAEDVAASIAAALRAAASLPGLSAEASGNTVVFQAPADAPTITDSGLWIGEGLPPVSVPGLGPWAVWVLALALVWLAARKFAPFRA